MLVILIVYCYCCRINRQQQKNKGGDNDLNEALLPNEYEAGGSTKEVEMQAYTSMPGATPMDMAYTSMPTTTAETEPALTVSELHRIADAGAVSTSMGAVDELEELLERLKLSAYLAPLRDAGFDELSDVATMSEEDLTASVGMKLGHARRLRKHFAESSDEM